MTGKNALAFFGACNDGKEKYFSSCFLKIDSERTREREREREGERERILEKSPVNDAFSIRSVPTLSRA